MNANNDLTPRSSLCPLAFPLADNHPQQSYEELLKHLRDILIPRYDQKAQISASRPVVRLPSLLRCIGW